MVQYNNTLNLCSNSNINIVLIVDQSPWPRHLSRPAGSLRYIPAVTDSGKPGVTAPLYDTLQRWEPACPIQVKYSECIPWVYAAQILVHKYPIPFFPLHPKE